MVLFVPLHLQNVVLFKFINTIREVAHIDLLRLSHTAFHLCLFVKTIKTYTFLFTFVFKIQDCCMQDNNFLVRQVL